MLQQQIHGVIEAYGEQCIERGTLFTVLFLSSYSTYHHYTQRVKSAILYSPDSVIFSSISGAYIQHPHYFMKNKCRTLLALILPCKIISYNRCSFSYSKYVLQIN